ncbi:MAG: relaxase, partial [Hymenobacter sp.]
SKLHQNLGLSHIQHELGLNAQKRALELAQQRELTKAQELAISPQNEQKQLKRGRGLSM